MKPQIRKRLAPLHALVWLAGLLTLAVPLAVQSAWGPRPAQVAGPQLSLAKTVDLAAVQPGDRVRYEVTLANGGDGAAAGVLVTDHLPPGFSYVLGSTQVHGDDILISTADPLISGQALTWGPFAVPAQRGDSFYGINSFVQERCQSGYIAWQLDRTRALAGPGGWVKQLFYGITPTWQAAPACWVDFVNGAYDRGLKPVLRLQGPHAGNYWQAPPAGEPGNYAAIAAAYRRVVASLPRRDGHTLFVQIWNEPNLDLEWSGAADPVAYGQFLVQTAAAIRAIGDSRIEVVNGPLSPGGDIAPDSFLTQMLAAVPDSLWAFDVWGAHPYPANHPPEYNGHHGTAVHPQMTIDSYQAELTLLAQHGRPYVRVLLSETGYSLGNNDFGWEGFPPIDEDNRADYTLRAFRDHWQHWAEVIGVMPFELTDPQGQWITWDWLAADGTPHPHFDAVRDLDKSHPYAASVLRLSFEAVVPLVPGVYGNGVSVTAANAAVQPLQDAAPVTVLGPTPTPTATPDGTLTPFPTATDTPAPTPTATATPTVTDTPSPTPSPTPCAPDPFEPDDEPALATVDFEWGQLVSHTFHHPQDEDWVRFDARRGVLYRVEAEGAGAARPRVALYDASGLGLLAVGQGSGQDDGLAWRAPWDGPVHVAVRQSGDGGNCAEAGYGLRITAMAKAVWLPAVGTGAPREGAAGGGSAISPRSLAVDTARGLLAEAGDGRLTLWDSATATEVARAAIDGLPQGLLFAPDGRSLYLATRDPGRVLRFDPASGRLLAFSAAPVAPGGLAWAGGRLWLADTAADRLLALEPATLAPVDALALPGAPYALAAASGGDRLFVGLAARGEVALVDVVGGAVLRRARLDGLGLPQGIAVDPASGRAFVAGRLAPRYGQVTILDGRGAVVGAIRPTLDRPLSGISALALDPSRRELFVAAVEGIEVFDQDSLQHKATLLDAGPAWPFGLAADSHRGVLFTAGLLAGSVQAHELDSSMR